MVTTKGGKKKRKNHDAFNLVEIGVTRACLTGLPATESPLPLLLPSSAVSTSNAVALLPLFSWLLSKFIGNRGIHTPETSKQTVQSANTPACMG